MTNKSTVKTWRERIGARPEFPLHAPTDVERAMEAEIAELRASIEGVRSVGALMANTMFNLGQRPGTVIDQRLADSMREMQRDWDVAVRTTPTAVQSATCTCPSGDGSLRWPCPVHPPEVGSQNVAAVEGGQKRAYGPDNPPRLRKPGESVEEYRVAMGWNQPEPAANTSGRISFETWWTAKAIEYQGRPFLSRREAAQEAWNAARPTAEVGVMGQEGGAA